VFHWDSRYGLGAIAAIVGLLRAAVGLVKEVRDTLDALGLGSDRAPTIDVQICGLDHRVGHLASMTLHKGAIRPGTPCSEEATSASLAINLGIFAYPPEKVYFRNPSRKGTRGGFCICLMSHDL
jgi:hypothetical protein